MKRRKNLLQIILSLFVFLFISCGIPNYFGDVSQYVSLTNEYFELNHKEYTNGFSTSQLQPKLMFLYTIFDEEKINNSNVTLSTIQKNLINEFKKKYKPSNENSILCPKFEGEPIVTTEIEGFTFGLYQFMPYDTGLSNWANDFLISSILEEDIRYGFSYSLVPYTPERDDVFKLRLTLSSSEEVVEDFDLLNTARLPFASNISFYGSNIPDDYSNVGISPVIYIIPVLYLDSSMYNNKQMLISSYWEELAIKQDKKDS